MQPEPSGLQLHQLPDEIREREVNVGFQCRFEHCRRAPSNVDHAAQIARVLVLSPKLSDSQGYVLHILTV